MWFFKKNSGIKNVFSPSYFAYKIGELINQQQQNHRLKIDCSQSHWGLNYVYSLFKIYFIDVKHKYYCTIYAIHHSMNITK